MAKASIGIASIPDLPYDTAEKLIDASDIALYEAKKKGRNRIELARQIRMLQNHMSG